MIYATYSEYINSSDWQKKRNERLKLDDYKCQKCGRPFDLQVHHLTYDHIYEERMEDLITLCKNCHHEIEEQKKAWKSPAQIAYENHYKNVNDFCEVYKHRDYSANGDLNMCDLKIIKPLMAEYFRTINDPYPYNTGVSEVTHYFSLKRYQVILNFINKGYPKYICKQRTRFSPAMIDKVYSRPEHYAERINKNK